MNMKTGLLGLLVGMVGWGLPLCSAAEKEMVENPTYKFWSTFKPGAFAKLKSTSVVKTEAGDVTTNSEMTTKLLELTPDKAVVEIKVTSPGAEMPAQKVEVPAKVVKGDPTTQPTGGQPGTVTEGEETIEVLGKPMKTKWTKIVIKQGDNTITFKSWTNAEVPGSVVKVEQNMEGQTKMKAETVMAEYKDGK